MFWLFFLQQKHYPERKFRMRFKYLTGNRIWCLKYLRCRCLSCAHVTSKFFHFWFRHAYFIGTMHTYMPTDIKPIKMFSFSQILGAKIVIIENEKCFQFSIRVQENLYRNYEIYKSYRNVKHTLTSREKHYFIRSFYRRRRFL